MRSVIHFIIVLGYFIRFLIWVNGGSGPLLSQGYLQPIVASPQDTLLANELAKRSVYNDDFFKKVLYTWTTKSQIDKLRSDKVLLTKSKSETKGYSIYDVSLRDTMLYDNSYAKLLKEDRFSKKRFAWAQAWATRMGWDDEKYGDQLIRIELKSDAYIGKLDLRNKEKPISFFDMKGNEIDQEIILKNADKIAVIYHVNFRKAKITQAHYRGTFSRKSKISKDEINASFREFVIVNENMITWEYGTSKILDELKGEYELVKQLVTYTETNNSKYLPSGLDYYWRTATNTNGLPGKYYTCLAFVNDQYICGKKTLSSIESAIASALKSQGSSLQK